MADDQDAPQLDRVVHAVGPVRFLALLGFAAGRPTLYVPDRLQTSHPLYLLLGEDRYLRLVAAAGGETVCLPSSSASVARGWRLRTVFEGLGAGTPTAEIAAAAGVSISRVRQIARALDAMKSAHRRRNRPKPIMTARSIARTDEMPQKTPLDEGNASCEPPPGLWRLASAASRIGMSAKALCAAADAGDIPIEVLRIGPGGLRYVRASEVEAFLSGDQKT